MTDKKIRARQLVNNAIRRGELVRPDVCSACGKPQRTSHYKLNGHHDDYDKPLEVRWLCQTCHHFAHMFDGYEFIE